MLARVEAVARECRQVDPAHERRLVVDDDKLLVMAVEGTLARVERHRDPRPARQLVARLPYFSAVRVEQRERRAGPGENAHVDALGSLREQLAQRGTFLLEAECGIEVPPGEVDVRAGRPDRLGDPRQRFPTVDEGLDAATRARRERCRLGPTAVGRWVDCLPTATTPQPPRVLGADHSLERLADYVVEAVQRIGSHGALMPCAPENLTRAWRTPNRRTSRIR
jgi:hypothetical protein